MLDLSIESAAGLRVELADLGARILDVKLPTKDGLTSLVCGYSRADHYLFDSFYMGATIGPIANRIRRGQFSVAGRDIRLPANQNGHCLHSADLGFNDKTWELIQQTASSVSFRLETQDQYFGKLLTTATYLVEELSLKVAYECQSEWTNYIDMTNHVYWNLNSDSADVTNHQFLLFASAYAEKDVDDIPTGAVLEIESPFNYSLSNKTAGFKGPVDHHFITSQQQNGLKQLCTARSPNSGIQLSVRSTKPGFQLYSGHFLKTPMVPFGGFCVEPQYVPNAINMTAFEAPLIGPENPYQHSIEYKFSQT